MWIQIIVDLSHRWMDQRALIAFHYFPRISLDEVSSQSIDVFYINFRNSHRDTEMTHTKSMRDGKIENLEI